MKICDEATVLARLSATGDPPHPGKILQIIPEKTENWKNEKSEHAAFTFFEKVSTVLDVLER